MGKNIIFDFDSTLIQKESLELILESLLKNNLHKLKEIEKITDLGMQGQISFKKSLEKRLAIACPTKQSIDEFVVKYCPSLLTDGISELVADLKHKYKIWIFSGGMTDSIIPFANYLDISIDNIFAVNVNWEQNGNFYNLNNANGACDSKLSAFTKVQNLFDGEIIIVGDGYTDYQLYESGFADKFIAYVEHVARENVVHKSKYVAKNVSQLRDFLL